MPSCKINIDIKPIPDQELVFNSTKKLNSVASTRRSGKTSGIKLYSLLRTCQGREQAIVMPDYMSYCREMYDDISDAGEKVFSSRSSSSLTLKTITGGRIRFFSYEAINKMRGKKFHEVYFDEFQSYNGDLADLKGILLPTLADYHGRAWFFGTPKKNTPIEEVANEKGDLWGHYKMQAINNPYITKEEIAMQREILPDLIFRQEWLAEFVDFATNLWAYEFKPEVHLVTGLELDPVARVYLGFDFNVDPCTCLIAQKIDDKEENGGGVNFVMEITNNGGTRQLAQMVRRWLDSQTNFRAAVHVTGDQSGSIRDSRANITDYQIIRDELKIPFSMFIDTTKSNPHLAFSRDLVNTCYYNNLVYIDKEKCPILAKDLSIARPKDGTDNVIKDRQLNKMDSFDAHRYILHAIFKGIDEVTRFNRIVHG